MSSQQIAGGPPTAEELANASRGFQPRVSSLSCGHQDWTDCMVGPSFKCYVCWLDHEIYVQRLLWPFAKEFRMDIRDFWCQFPGKIKANEAIPQGVGSQTQTENTDMQTVDSGESNGLATPPKSAGLSPENEPGSSSKVVLPQVTQLETDLTQLDLAQSPGHEEEPKSRLFGSPTSVEGKEARRRSRSFVIPNEPSSTTNSVAVRGPTDHATPAVQNSVDESAAVTPDSFATKLPGENVQMSTDPVTSVQIKQDAVKEESGSSVLSTPPDVPIKSEKETELDLKPELDQKPKLAKRPLRRTTARLAPKLQVAKKRAIKIEAKVKSKPKPKPKIPSKAKSKAEPKVKVEDSEVTMGATVAETIRLQPRERRATSKALELAEVSAGEASGVKRGRTTSVQKEAKDGPKQKKAKKTN